MRVECVFGDTTADQRARWSLRVRTLFPSLDVAFVPAPTDEAFLLDLEDWCDPKLSFWDFDCCTEEAVAKGATTFALVGASSALLPSALEALTRCQRLMARCNRHSNGSAFAAARAAHRALYDLKKPLLLADYRHALDTWQWTLRLESEASSALQLAALFHDIERISSEADVRIEHLAASYERFKTAHAVRGAEMTRLVLRQAELGPADVDRVVELVSRHETPRDDVELAVLNDADALSFFSLNSAGFIDYYGAAHTLRKIRYTLARMRRTAIAELATIRLRPDVARMTWQALGTADARPAASAP